MVFLKCSANNKGKTVLDSFYQATQQYKTPLKIRADDGTYNIEVARYMLKTVPNQRIERLWVNLETYSAFL